MKVIDLHGYSAEVTIGPEHGTSRLFIWCLTLEKDAFLSMHHHCGEELFRILYGKLRFTVGSETRDVGPGEVVIVPPGVQHAHTALEDTEVEIYGEVGAGIFVMEQGPDGSLRERELFVRGVPWSRIPPDESLYVTRAEQLQRFREQALDPIAGN